MEAVLGIKPKPKGKPSRSPVAPKTPALPANDYERQMDAVVGKGSQQQNPVAISGRVGGMLPPTAKMQQTAASSQPIYSAISNVLGLANVPGGAAGAFIPDVQAHRALGFGQPPSSNTAETHFGNLLMGSGGKTPGGQIAQAVNEYFPTSPSSMRQYSKGTGPLAATGSYFVKHPRHAALDFAGRILDPGNKLAFGAVGEGATALKMGTRMSARAIAKQS